MKQLICEMCGSNDLIKDNGVFVCQSCGCKYSIEEARKMMIEGTVDVSGSTIKVDNTGLIDSYLQMAENALEANNNEEAENYANKIIEIDPQSYRAWLIKGIASGWQTTGRNNRFTEAIVNWSNAYKYAPDDAKALVCIKIAEEARRISLAIIQMECNSFVRYQSDENCNDITNAVSRIESQFAELEKNTSIEVYDDSYKTQAARMINTAAVKGSDAADRDFGPENRNRDRYSWNRFTAAQDRCLELLGKAYDLSCDDSLSFTICKNYIMIAETVRDSCSYTYSSGYYVKEYSFTDKAVSVRNKTIAEWRVKRDKHDPEKRKELSRQALVLVRASVGAAEKEQAIAQYWQEHQEERAQLESELTELKARVRSIAFELASNPDKAEMDRLSAEIARLKKQQSSLGLFKGKEKRAIQSQIDGLESEKATSESRWETYRSDKVSEQDAANARIDAINAELSKDRGTARVVPSRRLALYANHVLQPTPLDLVDFFTSVTPSGFSVKGTGEDAIENYTKTLFERTQAALAMLNALLGKKSAETESKNYVDNPNNPKVYRINFTKGLNDTNSSVNFEGRTLKTPITGKVYYCLSEDKTASSVSDFICIVLSTITGICPDIDVNRLKTKIAEVSFGLEPETVIGCEGISVTISGSTKTDTKVTIAEK